ncbi:SIMPL domain-containing protein [Sphingomonas sp.]|uniref:SIMPL domain-containing protein n=1 Tax=Sphingomonas sp. TaxID=28214 RepID=UPI001ECCF39C|nr:SIMPL domain-containing protein [Sphingomonas sp.]MBX3593379.1 SIMPL domain-containing protein [Sphingomonas sp.]
MNRFTSLAALALAAPLVAHAQAAPPSLAPDGTLVDVVAEGVATRIPDIATIRAGVVTQGETAATALAANAQQMTRVLAALKAAGIADRDIQTASITLNPQYRYAENAPPVITGYQASNTVSVTFRDIATSGAILDALVAQGANQINGPDLSIDAIETAQDAARVDAVKRARARADLYARALGMRVERIVSLSESGGSGGSAPVRMMARMEAKAPTPVAAGEQEVRVSVRVRFLLR